MPKPIRNSRTVRPLKSKGMATRAAILDAAHEVFKDTGYYGSSISEISRRCGVSMGTFYHYFKNKEQVFLELNDQIISRFMETGRILTPNGSWIRREVATGHRASHGPYPGKFCLPSYFGRIRTHRPSHHRLL